MVSMKKLMSLSQYEMGVLDGIAKVKDMLAEKNSCSGKISRLIDDFYNNAQSEMIDEPDVSSTVTEEAYETESESGDKYD